MKEKRIDWTKVLSTDAAKIEALKTINDEFEKTDIIETLSTDAAKIKAMQTITNETLRAEIIETFSTDEAKLEGIKTIRNEYAKENIIISLSTDAAKIEAMETINDESAKAEIIETFSTDEIKLKAMEKINDEYYKAYIIGTLSTDALKLKAMETINDEIAKARIIRTLSTDALKLKAMETINDEISKATIIKTLSTDEAKINAMNTIKNEKERSSIIKTLSTDQTKLKAMKMINDESLKAEIIETFSTVEKKIYAIKKIYKISLTEDYKCNKKIKLPPDMTIGCEVESEGKISKALNGVKIFEWKGKNDGSLNDGVEMVSPIMHSDEESINGIYKICDILKQMNNSTSERCGGHIHIGADYLKDKQAYANLLSIYGNTEKLLYIIANDPNDITNRTTEFDRPFSKDLESAIERGVINLETEQDVNEFIEELNQIQRDRFSGINFMSYYKHNTIEFRLPNGTINPNAWIENINLFGGIVKAAQDISIIQKKPVEDRSEDENKKMELFEKLQTEDLDDKSKLETLLELVIDKEGRDIYRNRYNENVKLLTDKQKKEIRNGTSSNPIKSKDIGKKAFNDSMEEAER